MDFDVPGVVRMSASEKLADLPELATGPGASGAPATATASPSSTRADPPRTSEVNTHLYAARDARRAKRWADAVKSYEAAIKLAPEDSRLFDSTAWFLLTVDDEKLQDPKRAVELATRAVELTEEKSGQYLGTLAEALHRAGDLEGAANRAEAAAKLDPHPERKERAERYRKELDKKVSECRARAEAKAKADATPAPAAKRRSALPEWPPAGSKAEKTSKVGKADESTPVATETTPEAADTPKVDTSAGTPTWAVIAIGLAGLACAGGVALALRRALGNLR